MTAEEKKEIVEAVTNVLKKEEKPTINWSYVLQGIVVAGIIGLWAQFQSVRDATTISKSERAALKENLNELKQEVRSLRSAFYLQYDSAKQEK